jgi:multicomponent Na+:H+ antiporter subunit C
MNTLPFFLLTGAGLFALGFYALIHRKNLIRKVLALNIMGNGVFLILIATAKRNETTVPDPVPQAMVLTGIVVAVCATAFALSLIERITRVTGKATLEEDPEDD